MRWVDAYFPFTDPSAELEIFFRVSNFDSLHGLKTSVGPTAILDREDNAPV